VPIATQCLHAAGSALAFKVRNEPRVAVTVVGDGGSSKGDFYGAINVAGAMQLPLVAVIVNNQWAISVPRNAQTGAKTLAQKGIAAGLECLQVDGNDLIAMRTAMDFAIKRARHGHGGMVIEAVTYRLSDHTTADDARRYRPDDEVKAAWQREPLKRMKAYLMSLNAWTEEEEEAWKAECAAKVDAEVNAYLETKSQPIEAMFDYTWAEPADLAAQRAEAIGANVDLGRITNRCDGECDGERSQVRRTSSAHIDTDRPTSTPANHTFESTQVIVPRAKRCRTAGRNEKSKPKDLPLAATAGAISGAKTAQETVRRQFAAFQLVVRLHAGSERTFRSACRNWRGSRWKPIR
jgi:hypothetical protein